tara:strand:- start:247 stop:579 length:333 start_codon:yes stop_codon:yes gene_type:complete
MSKFSQHFEKQSRERIENGMKLYRVNMEVIQYPYLYVWANEEDAAKQYAMALANEIGSDDDRQGFYESPSKPVLWKHVGEPHEIVEREIERFDLYCRDLPEACNAKFEGE